VIHEPASSDPAREAIRARIAGVITLLRWRSGLLIATLVVLAGMAVGLGWILAPKSQPVPLQIASALTVTTALPRTAVWPDTLLGTGAIGAWQEASVAARIGQYPLIEVRVNVGDRVRKGQVLARFDAALLRAEEDQLVAASDQAEANRLRGISLQAVGGISDQDLLQLVTEARTAAARLAAKRLELSYTVVHAPDDGVISARAATLGAVTPAGQELFRLILRDRLEWRGEITVAQLSRIGAGQLVTLKLPDGTAADAVVRQTAPVLTGQSRLGVVFADLIPGSSARAGMYASGAIVAGRSPALVVPAECVIIRDGRSYVAELVGAAAVRRAVLREVTVGRRTIDSVEIVRGLRGEERLALRGAGFLKDGDAVRVADSAGASS
jgi:RND family efflux transporter MFP subunit